MVSYCELLLHHCHTESVRWQTALYNSVSYYEPSAEKGLARLLPGLLNMIGENMDLLSKSLSLLESYLLLDAASLINVSLTMTSSSSSKNMGPQVCEALAQALGISKPNADSTRRILHSLSLLIRTAPIQDLAPLLINSGIFSGIITALEDDKASGLILAAFLDVLARIAMIDPQIFLRMVGEVGKHNHRDPAKVLEEVLDAMWRNFDYVGEARMRKAVAMGAGSLLTTGDAHVLDRLDGEFSELLVIKHPLNDSEYFP